jgi:predicted Zn-dependent protease
MLSLFYNNASFKQESIPAEMLRLLADIGYVATGSGKKKNAEVIFGGLIAARPQNELLYVAYAFMQMAFGEYTEASKLLIEKALKINPASETVKAFYGMLLYRVGRRGEGYIVLNQLKENGKDANAVALAECIIKEG